MYHAKSHDNNDNISSLFGLYNATGISRVRDELGYVSRRGTLYEMTPPLNQHLCVVSLAKASK